VWVPVQCFPCQRICKSVHVVLIVPTLNSVNTLPGKNKPGFL
jgi:heterodisulfide reductase subunit C